MQLIFRILFVVVILGIPVLWILDPNKNSPVTLLTMVIMEVLAILLMWFWLTFSREAQKIKFPKPDAPILDQL